MNRMKAKIAIVLSALMVALLCQPMLTAFAAANPTPIEKHKSATALDTNNQTTVTLALPATEEAREVDMVFVVDKSQYADANAISNATDEMLSELVSLQESNPNLSIRVGIVKFDAWGIDSIQKYTNGAYSGLVALDGDTKTMLMNCLDASRETSTADLGGTNTEQPIRFAQQMLAGGAADAEKYLLVCTDFSSYVYEGSATVDGVTYNNLPVGSADAIETDPQVSIWENLHHYAKNGTDFCEVNLDWATLYAAYQAGTLGTATDWGHDEIFFRQSSIGQWNASNLGTYIDQSAEQYMATGNALKDSIQEYGHISAMYRSAILTYNALTGAMANGTKVIAYRAQDGNVGESRVISGMLEAINGYSNATVYDAYKSDVDLSNVFGSVNDEITYLLASGTVEDAIGKDFDLVNANNTPFQLTVSGVRQNVTKLSANEWAFGTQGQDGKYPYVVRYDTASETLRWAINTPVTKDRQIALSYKLQLTALTAGSHNTNEYAWLSYTDSNGTSYDAEYFEVPTVTYVVPAVATATPAATSTPATTDDTPAATPAPTAVIRRVVTPVATATPVAPVTTITDQTPPQGANNDSTKPADNNPVDIEDETTPLAAGAKEAWALINLICVIASAVLAVVLLVSKHRKADEDQKEESGEEANHDNKSKRSTWAKVAGVVEAVIAVVAFFLTENLTLPMAWVDNWTILMVVLLIFSIVTLVFGLKWKKADQEQQ